MDRSKTNVELISVLLEHTTYLTTLHTQMGNEADSNHACTAALKPVRLAQSSQMAFAKGLRTAASI